MLLSYVKEGQDEEDVKQDGLMISKRLMCCFVGLVVNWDYCSTVHYVS